MQSPSLASKAPVLRLPVKHLHARRNLEPVLLFTDPGVGHRLDDTGIRQIARLEFDLFRLVRVVVVDTIATAGTEFRGTDIATLRRTLPMRHLATEYNAFGLHHGGDAESAGRQFLALPAVTGNDHLRWPQQFIGYLATLACPLDRIFDRVQRVHLSIRLIWTTYCGGSFSFGSDITAITSASSSPSAR